MFESLKEQIKRLIIKNDNGVKKIIDFAGKEYGYFYFYCQTESDEKIIVAVNQTNVEDSTKYFFKKITDLGNWHRLTADHSTKIAK
ncbi:MAG TPA: hypothetical protein VJ962_05885 [Clostridia bacterium]|nr:hypothetical protein [Clostridia bacterium]